MKRVLVLGGSGMLGAMIVDCLDRDPELTVRATVRESEFLGRGLELIPTVEWLDFDAAVSNEGRLRDILAGCDWVLNAIGITKPYIRDDNAGEVERAVRVNSLFPHVLAAAAIRENARVIQIATDCVYTGTKGSYVESDPHDAEDVYGKSKSLGESPSVSMLHLRCSIVGPEPGRRSFLLEWFRDLPEGEHINGFRHHEWNGITTLHFARLCHGIISGDAEARVGVRHVVPEGRVTKDELLRCFAQAFDREDVMITPIETSLAIDRTLATGHEEENRILWRGAGYTAPPTIMKMMAELAKFDFRLENLR